MSRRNAVLGLLLCSSLLACSDLRPADNVASRNPAVDVPVDAALEDPAAGKPGDKKSKRAAAPAAAAPARPVVLNASGVRGGTLRMASSEPWDSLDPANTRRPYARNFLRNYGRTLLVFAAGPGVQLVPDLASGLGKPSNGNKTWTYTLRSGVKYEDGSPITSRDVKYAVERSLDKSVFPEGPSFFNEVLDLQGYTSPYNDAHPEKLGLAAIETPDDQTIVFRLIRPFAAFDYLAQLPATMPVPRAKDTKGKYGEAVVASGPYRFESKTAKRLALVRNNNYDPATDPNGGRRALPDRIEIDLDVPADSIDARLLSGELDVDASGRGLRAAAAAKALRDPVLKRNLATSTPSETHYTFVNSDLAPLDNVACRKAVLHAVDRQAYQLAYGGSLFVDIATGVMPPVIPGAGLLDLYNVAGTPTGDLGKARKALESCGNPAGFATQIGFRGDRPADRAAAEAVRTALARVGIGAELRAMPAKDYYRFYAGDRDYLKARSVGLVIASRQADWPEAMGFLAPMADSRAIRAVGANTNLGVRSPEIDALIDKAERSSEAHTRQTAWTEIDRKLLEGGYVVPALWTKALLYPPPQLTNVYINGAFEMYDYAVLGTTRR